MKCLGKIRYPSITVRDYSHSTGLVTLRLEGGDKYVTLEIGVQWARTMVTIAREIVGRLDEHIQRERRECDRLAEYVGYKEQS